MKAKITEIFSSIQGEGPYVGIKQVFVRFFGCNTKCVWCDTQKSSFKEYSIKEAASKIRLLSAYSHSVSFTGGEPLLYKDFIKELLPLVKRMNLKVYLETNGILYKELKEIIQGIDIVAMDFKLPTSTKTAAYWKEHEQFLRIARRKEVFVKAVISKDTQKKDIQKAIKIIQSVDPRVMFILQPNSQDKNFSIKKCLAYQKICEEKLADVRVIAQVHKILKVR